MSSPPLAVVTTTFLALLISLSFAQSAATCRRPRTPYNGNFTSSSRYGFPTGTVVKFYCHPGYMLKGFLKIWCKSNGEWSEKAPLCIRKEGVECDDAPSIVHGFLNGSSDYPRVGSSIMYTCEKGYKLVGTKTRTCQINREWSGDTPSCNRVRCSLPPNPAHGTISYGTLMYGDQITYQCTYSPCWTLRGNRKRTCTEDGTWSGYSPTCVKSGCSLFEDIDYGEVMYYRNNVPFYPLYCATFGIKAKFKCSDNYYPESGSSLRTCMSNGEWSGTGSPVCKAKTCDNPPNIFNGKWERCTASQFNGDSKCVHYTCQSNYLLWGVSTLTCFTSPRIQWDNVPPRCLTLTQYTEACTALGRTFVWDKDSGVPSCIPPGDNDASSSDSRRAEVGTLTIVTATAGSIFGILIVLLFVVTCQRRRNHNYMRSLRRRSRRSFDDHCSLIAYSGEVHFVLPSYDEAITQDQREPPSFESAVGADAPQEENAQEGSSSEQTQSEESVTDPPASSSQDTAESSETEAARQCTVTENPIYEEIGSSRQETSQSNQETLNNEPETSLEPADLGAMSMWTLLA